LRTIVGRAVRLTVTSLALVWTASAAAEVRLENSVKKVETYVSDSGDVERRLVDADSVVPGDELRYTITFTNVGAEVVDAGSIVITNPIPENTQYVEGSAFGSGTVIVYSTDGESFASAESLRVQEGGVEVSASAKDYTAIRWTFQPELGPGGTGDVSFNVRLK
jgi:uncharacterized repeat protein (TIGR01451 family)